MRIVTVVLITNMLLSTLAYGDDEGWVDVPLDTPTVTEPSQERHNSVTVNNNVSGPSDICASQLILTQKDLVHEKLLKRSAIRELIHEQDNTKRFLGIPGPIWFIIGGVAGASAVYFGARR